MCHILGKVSTGDPSVYDFVPSQSSPKGKQRKRASARSKGKRAAKADVKEQRKKDQPSNTDHKRRRLAQLNEEWGIKGTNDDQPEPHSPEHEETMSQITKLKNHIDDIDSNVELVCEKRERHKKKCRFDAGGQNGGNDSTIDDTAHRQTDKNLNEDSNEHSSVAAEIQRTKSAKIEGDASSPHVIVKIEVPADSTSASAIMVTPKPTLPAAAGKESDVAC